MKNIRVFLSENFQFLEVNFSIYLNRHVFVMLTTLFPGPDEIPNADLPMRNDTCLF